MLKTKTKIQNFFRRFLLIDDTPHKVAGGAALGVFLGIIPGEGVTASLVLATLFRLNKISATAGALATNMWTTVIVLPLAAFIGGWFFKVSPAQLMDEFHTTFNSGWKHFWGKTIFLNLALPLLVGFLLVASLTAAIIYTVLYFLLRYQHLRKTHLFHKQS